MTQRPASSPKAPDLRPSRLEEAGFSARYERGALLGRGGMGEVYECRDLRIGRDVAMKIVRGGDGEDQSGAEVSASARTISSSTLDRFIREARVQGQLEHPAIVPVYDLGLGEDGLPFFTMKRLGGLSLADVLRAHRARDADVMARFGRHKLLADFGTICLAVEFAHERGVLHRDLKPDNIMLGDFGEVSVLDWGIARVDASSDARDHSAALTKSTQRGQILGTLGYAAPEQLRATAPVDARADIYALGAILFEILCLEPMHAGESLSAIERSVLIGVDVKARLRASGHDVAPELVAACERAVDLSPERRYPSARALHAAVEGYLEGDRDRKRRSEISAKHAEAAASLADRAQAGDDRARAQAMLEAGRALALDPENPEAARVLTTLLLAPPKEMPREVSEKLAEDEMKVFQKGSIEGARFAAGSLIAIPLLAWAGVRDARVIVALVLFVVGHVVIAWIAKRPLRPFVWKLCFALSLLCTIGIVAMIGRLWGSLIMAPTVATLILTTAAIQFRKRHHMLLAGAYSLVLLGPLALEIAGVLPPSYTFRDGAMLVMPNTVALTPTATLVTLAVMSVFTMAGAANLTDNIVRELRDARTSLALQAWQLAHLVPDGARRQSAATTEAPISRGSASEGARPHETPAPASPHK